MRPYYGCHLQNLIMNLEGDIKSSLAPIHFESRKRKKRMTPLPGTAVMKQGVHSDYQQEPGELYRRQKHGNLSPECKNWCGYNNCRWLCHRQKRCRSVCRAEGFYDGGESAPGRNHHSNYRKKRKGHQWCNCR